MEDFEEIVFLLRICHKYIATNLEERIISYLAPMFPRTLEKFLFSETDERKLSAPFDYTSPACNVRIANAAREVGAFRLLPAALYRLCRLTPDQLLYSTLSPDNLRAVMVGRSRLSTFTRVATYSHLFGDVLCSHGRPCCDTSRLTLAIRLSYTDGWLDPLAPFDVTVYHALCVRCIQRAQLNNQDGRLRTWEKLPAFFTLPDSTWEVADDDKSVELYGTYFACIDLLHGC